MAGALRHERKASLPALFALALLLVFGLSPPASAQSPAAAEEQIPGSGPIGEAIRDTTTIAGDAIQETTSTLGNAAGETGVTVGKIIDDNTGTGLGDTVGDAAEAGGATLKKTGGTAGRVITDTGKTIGDRADAVLNDTPLGDGDGDPDPGGNGDGRDPIKDGSKDPKGALTRERVAAPAEQAAQRSGSSALLAEISPDVQAAQLAPAFTVAEALQQAIEAAKLFAFPLALTLLVVGFMLIQNKIDKKDPKLALAAVDTTDELLSFS